MHQDEISEFKETKNLKASQKTSGSLLKIIELVVMTKNIT